MRILGLKLIRIKRRRSFGHRQGEYLCGCGRRFVCNISDVRRGVTLSCGCRRIASSRRRFFKHGDSVEVDRVPEYDCWRQLKYRCLNQQSATYEYCGGRGIKVCARWKNSYAAFLKDVGRRPSPSHSLDRINNDKGYYPRNCRWATKAEQAQNRRRSVRRA